LRQDNISNFSYL